MSRITARDPSRSPENSRVVALHSLCDFYRRVDNRLAFSCPQHHRRKSNNTKSGNLLSPGKGSIRHSTRVGSDSLTAACQSISRQAMRLQGTSLSIEQRAEAFPDSILSSSRQNAQYLGGSSCVCDARYGRGFLSPQSNKGPAIQTPSRRRVLLLNLHHLRSQQLCA
jgi:hypothetical protein